MDIPNHLPSNFSTIRRLIIPFLLLAAVLSGCRPEEKGPPTHLYVVNVDEPEPSVLLSDPAVEFWGPAWSPDGRQIVFSYLVFEPGGTRPISAELYLSAADGSGLRRLTNNGRSNYLPEWSPDGASISYLSQDLEDESADSAEIYVVHMESGEETRLTHNDVFDYGSSWSPDGTQIVFGSEEGGEWQIRIMNSDGSSRRSLPTPAHGNAPDWSPDGSRIVFTSDRTGRDDIWIMNPDGSGQANLTNSPDTWEDNPRWSPDGTRIAYNAGLFGEVTGIWIMQADGTLAVNLTDGLLLEALIPTWAPDGLSLVFHAGVRSGEGSE